MQLEMNEDFNQISEIRKTERSMSDNRVAELSPVKKTYTTNPQGAQGSMSQASKSKSKSLSGNAGKDAENPATIAPQTLVSQFGTLQSQQNKELKPISNDQVITVCKVH